MTMMREANGNNTRGNAAKTTKGGKKTGKTSKKKQPHQPFKENETPGQNGKFTRGMVRNIQNMRDDHDKATIEWFDTMEEFANEEVEKEWSKEVFIDHSDAFKDLPDREKIRIQRIKKRSDPNVAPDEPVPLRLRPWNAHPKDAQKVTVQYTYRNALGTVGECKNEIAKQLDVPIGSVELINAGRRLGRDDATFHDLHILAGYVVYFRVNSRKEESERKKKEKMDDPEAPTSEGVACWQHYKIIEKD
jgi:hypothetical protein